MERTSTGGNDRRVKEADSRIRGKHLKHGLKIDKNANAIEEEEENVKEHSQIEHWIRAKRDSVGSYKDKILALAEVQQVQKLSCRRFGKESNTLH